MTPVLLPEPAPDFSRLKDMVLSGLISPHTRRAYHHALETFFRWYAAAGRPPFDKHLLQSWRAELQHRRLSPASINVQLSAIRRLAAEAEEAALLAPGQAAALSRVKGVRRQGVRAGNWLTADQARRLLHAPDSATLRGRRDRAILALLIGCGLRRTELVSLQIDQIQLREGRWVIPDLEGKGNRLRTVPVPGWVKDTLDGWILGAALSTGPLFRGVNKAGRIGGPGLSEKVIWQVVRSHAAALGFPNLAPHDLRRTCAKLCRAAGGELEQIQFLLGHASIQTTERYLGTRQDLQDAVNDRIGIEP